MKKALVLGGLAVGGFLVWRMFRVGALQSPSSLSPYNTAPDIGGQPSAQYPYRPVQTPRADAGNQPWYQGNRDFIQPQTSVGDPNFLKNVQYVKGVADISSSVASIWDDLSGLFGTQDDPNTGKNNIVSADSGGIDWANLGLA